MPTVLYIDMEINWRVPISCFGQLHTFAPTISGYQVQFSSHSCHYTSIPLATVASKTADTGGMISHGSHSRAVPEIPTCQMTAEKEATLLTLLIVLPDVAKTLVMMCRCV